MASTPPAPSDPRRLQSDGGGAATSISIKRSRSRIALQLLLGALLVVALVIGWRSFTSIRTKPVEIRRLQNGTFLLVTERVPRISKAEAYATFPRSIPLVTLEADGTRTPGMIVPYLPDGTLPPIEMPSTVALRGTSFQLEMGLYAFTNHGNGGAMPPGSARVMRHSVPVTIEIADYQPVSGPTWYERLWRRVVGP